MAKPNYGLDKRQREIKKSKQQEEKRLKKQARNATPEEQAPEPPTSPSQNS